MLSTGEPPIQATLGKNAKKPQPLFTSEELNRLQTKMSVSDNKMKIAGNFLRVKCGRKSFINLKKDMTERNKIFAEDFEHKVIKQRIYKKCRQRIYDVTEIARVAQTIAVPLICKHVLVQRYTTVISYKILFCSSSIF